MYDYVSSPGFEGDPWATAPAGMPQTDFIAKFNHVPGGLNCLYMDGHVDFVEYPNEENYPLSEPFLEVIQAAIDAGLLGD